MHNLKDKLKQILGEEVPVVTLIALKADHFIANGASNVSCTLDVFKD